MKHISYAWAKTVHGLQWGFLDTLIFFTDFDRVYIILIPKCLGYFSPYHKLRGITINVLTIYF